MCEFLAKRGSQDRVPGRFFGFHWHFFFFFGRLLGDGRLDLLADGGDGVDILVLVVEVHNFAFGIIFESVGVLLVVALGVGISLGGDSLHFFARVYRRRRVVQIHPLKVKIYTHLI